MRETNGHLVKEVDDIHRPFMKWLNERQIPYVYHRADRKSGIHKGHPDFTILFMRRQIMIECKTAIGKLSDDQKSRIDFLRRQGNVVEIARNLAECIEAIGSILCEGTSKTSDSVTCDYPLRGCFKELKHAVAKVPCNGKTNPDPFYIAPWMGVDYVFARATGGEYRMIRKASGDDILNLPKLKI
jgi:hypothetical protein